MITLYKVKHALTQLLATVGQVKKKSSRRKHNPIYSKSSRSKAKRSKTRRNKHLKSNYDKSKGKKYKPKKLNA